jgi:hypothetical protein
LVSLWAGLLALLTNVVTGEPDGTGGFALETPGGEQRVRFKNGARLLSNSAQPLALVETPAGRDGFSRQKHYETIYH